MAVARQHQVSPMEPSPSPQPAAAAQPLTKRDVRRNRIMERLQTMIDSFSANKHQHYRAQLQAVQVDMTLVLSADPYVNGPLPDSGDEIRCLVDGMMSASGVGDDEAAQRDYAAMAGRRYADFVTEVNNCLEKRDADLTALHSNYHNSVAELDRLTQQKLHQAEEEHKALANSIRQRLVTSITKKRQHLLRDKEQLDIAESNALLLHPSHFSINNPGSPGGGHNRKTRHLRHRAVSPGGDVGDNGKRKRKAAAMEEEGHESPVPAFRPLLAPDALGGGRSPFKDARDRNIYTQYEAPAYSLERIFTDKELAMATATAQQATYRYFHQPPPQPHEHGSNTNGTAASVDGETLPDAGHGDDAAHLTTEAGVNTPPPAHASGAPGMERSTSHQVLTRGGARANPLAALSELATAATTSAPVRDNPFAPVVPSYHAISRSEKSGAPAPPGVGALDMENDFEMMRRAADTDPDDADESPRHHSYDPTAATGTDMRRQLLDQALGLPPMAQPFRLPLIEAGPALVPPRIDRPSYTGFAMPAAYEAQRMKQTISNFAGVPPGSTGPSGSLAAALQGRLASGEPMSRTTSVGAGSEVGEGRRGRRG